jgi:signal transduction histidine kinase
VQRAYRKLAYGPYAVALACVLAGTAARVLLEPVLRGTQAWLTFWPAVFAAAVFGGARGAFFSTVGSVAVVWLWVLPDSVLHTRGALAGTIVFVACATAFALVTDAARAAHEAALRASRAKDEFLAMLGHELRNPLAPIVTALELMRSGAVNSERARTIIERQVKHMVHLVDDLLDVSRITRGKVELDLKPVKVAAVVARAIETARPLLVERRHRLDVAQPSEDLWLSADETRMAQVLTNLLRNAAKYTNPDGIIRLVIERDGEWAVMRVRDNGIGISPELLPRVFDLFLQAEQGIDRRQGGLGIGLALVKSLVQMHGGSVTATSAGADQGSEFVVRVPALAAQPVEAVAGGDGLVDAQLPAVRRRRILVVDDNDDAATILGDLLETAGHDVKTAHDGPQALALLDAFVPDVAILDIGLPVMDGYELAGALRKRLGDGVRIVAVTGYGQPQDRARTEEAGFDAHFVKPVGVGTLLAEIEA